MDFTNFDATADLVDLEACGNHRYVVADCGNTPVAWWLAHTRSRFRVFVEAVVALPLVLPPTVLGFYLLIALGPNGWLGGPVQKHLQDPLFPSPSPDWSSPRRYTHCHLWYKPLHSTFEAVGKIPLETAWSLRASRLDAFLTVASPLGLRGYITAVVLGFAHTLGEFGVVLDGRWKHSWKNQGDFYRHL